MIAINLLSIDFSTIGSFKFVINMVFVVISVGIMAYLISSIVNEKMVYDINGITIWNIARQKEFISWKDIISIETDFISKTMKIDPSYVIIKYNKNGRENSLSYRYGEYIGLKGLMDYYEMIIKR